MRRRMISVFAILLFVVGSLTTWASPAWADTYYNFAALKSHKTLNVDYKIVSRDTASSTAVIAIHGGNIEKETSEVADAVASRGGFDFYTFKGLKASSGSLHITSTNFDEPTARKLVAKSTKTLSIHGSYGGVPYATNLGGLDKTLEQKVKSALQKAGFKVVTPPPSLAGAAKGNICNRNSVHKGVQLELESTLRNQLAKDPKAFDRYVNALVQALGPSAKAVETPADNPSVQDSTTAAPSQTGTPGQTSSTVAPDSANVTAPADSPAVTDAANTSGQTDSASDQTTASTDN